MAVSGGDLVVDDRGGGSSSQPLLSTVETVRVLSVEVVEGDGGAC